MLNKRADLEINHPLIELEEWTINPEITFLNHGSFGACPRTLLKAQRDLTDALEYDPVHFMLYQLPELIQESRLELSRFLHGRAEGFVFIENASAGVATALASIKWRPGDEVILSQDSYPACRHMLTELARRYKLVLKIAETPFALTSSEAQSLSSVIVSAFRAQISERTRLILIDHITSPTALVYPARELVELARATGALSLVDGAHAPGQLALDLDRVGADFYVGNLHKWVFTPKSCAFLYVAPERRDSLLPHVISHGYLAVAQERYHALFDWTGTRDYSAACVSPRALKWIEMRCGWDRLRARNHHLVVAARALIMEALWDEPLPALPPVSALGHMAAIPLPEALARVEESRARQNREDRESEPKPIGSAAARALHPVQVALRARGFEVPVIHTAHGVMIRISAQAYNTLSDYQALARALCELQLAL